jgi:AraC family transcriptional regulator
VTRDHRRNIAGVLSTPTVRSREVRLADYPASAVFGPRRLRDFEFVWVLRGSARWTIADSGAEFLLRPGVLALASVGTTDSYRWDPDRPSTHAYVHFELTGHDHETGVLSWPEVRSMAELPVLDGCCRYLLQLAGDPSRAAVDRRNQVIEMMLDIFVNGPVPTAEPTAPDFMIMIADHVRSVWDADGIRAIGVEELAATLHVSAGHLHRLFRDHLGVGPGRALELVRLSRAAEALVRSTATIAEIANLTGFANPYHFSRRFRLTYGVAPGGYRSSDDRIDPLAPLQDSNLLPLSYRLG